MSEYMIDLCETLEALTGIDFDAIQQALLASYLPTASEYPDPRSKREMRRLATWLSRRLACF